MNMYTMQRRGVPARAAGFTLIEMIAVLVLIGVVMAIVGGRVMQNFQSGQYKAGVAGVKSLEMKVQAYNLDNGGNPQSLSISSRAPATRATGMVPTRKNRISRTRSAIRTRTKPRAITATSTSSFSARMVRRVATH